MKTLFRKSNIVHIRTNEGEFEVSNPEVLTCLHIRHMPDGDWRIKTPGSGWTGEDVKWPVEWPYGVELIKQRGAINLTVARLIPEEKKAESAYKEFEGKDLHIVTPESPEPQDKEFILCKLKQTHNISQSMIDEAMSFIKLYVKESVSAPSESQEELWRECLSEIDEMARDIDQYEYGLPWYEDPKSGTIQDRVMKRFTITRNP